MRNLTRCSWCTDDPLYIEYHDNEWGKPVYDDRTLFEFLVLESAQAGLSWITILKRREGYRKAFENFEVEKVARFDEARVEQLMQETSIIRNRLKITSAINNAKQVMKMKDQGISLSDYLWDFVDGEPIVGQYKTLADVPCLSPISDAMTKDLKKRGFRFVGTKICYSLMQACGLVNDHTTDCFRYPG